MMAKVTKVIKPKGIKRNVFEPKMKEGLQETADFMEKQFLKTTRTFTTPVKFKRKFRLRGAPLTVEVFTTNKIYGYIDRGTKAHTITPKKKNGVLAFPATTRPKTTPRLISSNKGFKSKKMIFVRGPVNVKGIKARKFTIEIQKLTRPRFKKTMQKKLNEAAKMSGLAMRKI